MTRSVMFSIIDAGYFLKKRRRQNGGLAPVVNANTPTVFFGTHTQRSMCFGMMGYLLHTYSNTVTVLFLDGCLKVSNDHQMITILELAFCAVLRT